MFYGDTKDNNGYYNIILQYANEVTLREYLKTKFTKLQWSAFEEYPNSSKKIKNCRFWTIKADKQTSMTSKSIVHGIPAYIEPKRLINHIISEQIIKYANKSRLERDGYILKEVVRITFEQFYDEPKFNKICQEDFEKNWKASNLVLSIEKLNMLIERIMHECIKQLLAIQNRVPEEIEMERL
ncbi:ARM repeat-containing protein [Gigaspora margarita]|uniref:ARM repeat-containing protein n=1 Tax=Gigaspora margarita TaxID=4874 RepID=A0A8H4AT77_GIGMA|nr:ARM repeat-containing protein [Gigaspora margarita]